MIILDTCKFGWWNTGLSPCGKDRATEASYSIAIGVIQNLMTKYGIGFLGLAEVTTIDLERIRAGLSHDNFRVFDGTEKIGRLQFDTGAIYNREMFTIRDSQTVTDRFGKKKLKLASVIELEMGKQKETAHLLLSHWPSKIYGDSAKNRMVLVNNLRNKVNALRSDNGENTPVILMGDFNEEPFNGLETYLLATRDRLLAKQNSNYLYNPFFRHIGESSPMGNWPSFAGTSFYAGGNDTRWRNLDHIIFSSSFLGNSRWHLDEGETRIIYEAPLALPRNTDTKIFDHFPIMATLNKLEVETEAENVYVL